MDDIDDVCRFFEFLISASMTFATCMDIPQKSGTKCTHCAWQVAPHSVRLVSVAVP